MSLCAAGEWRLAIRDWPEPPPFPLSAEPTESFAIGHDSLLVAGSFSPPDFSIADISQARLTDGLGRPIELLVERSSLFEEFGEIVGMRIAFRLPVDSLAAGLPVLSWGAGVTAPVRAIDRFVFPDSARPQLRTFVPEPVTDPDAAPPRFATIEVIADSHADTYYLWYLLPMAVIFLMLAIRKALPR